MVNTVQELHPGKSAVPEVSETERLLRDFVGSLEPGSRRRLAEYRIPQGAQELLDEWAEKNREGEITASELADYEGLVAACSHLAAIAAIARACSDGE